MFSEKSKPLTKMDNGQSGIVKEISGGHGAVRRLKILGIRPGQKITKVSSMFMKGPVTVKTGHTKVGIGYGLASKVIVETKK